ncbi:MAG TPA: alpha/beta hydrolase [Edaphocola sp.]|nr:alpha/beta hydrolase [Edaphocola sp.]
MLYYEKQGRGPAVVLLHGLPCDHTIWNNLVAKLSNRYCFVLPDFPGAGNSLERPEGFLLKDIALELKAILDKEDIGEAVIAGHSMGGYTAMAFAKLFPGKTKALSLIHSSAAADSEEKKQIRRKSIAMIQKGEAEKQAFVRTLVRQLFARTFVQDHPGIVNNAVRTGNRPSAQSLVNYYQALMEREDNIPVLSSAGFPFQWILGTEDSATVLEDTLPLITAAGINDICIYPSCGHMGMLEMPDRLQADLDRFWQYVHREE